MIGNCLNYVQQKYKNTANYKPQVNENERYYRHSDSKCSYLMTSSDPLHMK